MKLLLWKARNKRKITTENLSKLTKISVGALNNYENGKRSPTMNQIEIIAAALEMHIEELYSSKYK